jgi:aryl-alcohol dehydrogenase-like predicted oxidoreductase
MDKRRVGSFEVSAIGLGCMSLSQSYGPPPPRDQAERVLKGALDAGYTFLDTAAVYGLGHNERLVGEVLKGRLGEIVLASKCGMTRGETRDLNGSPERLKQTCDESLARLGVETIDLYYLHRWDKRVPIEDSVGALADLVAAGKIRSIGLSEVSAATLRRAHAVHPIAALQTEYSPWTRNPEIAVLEACRELGVAFVAFSPVGRGFLAGGVRDPGELAPSDMRVGMPRFQGEALAANLKLLDYCAHSGHRRSRPHGGERQGGGRPPGSRDPHPARSPGEREDRQRPSLCPSHAGQHRHGRLRYPPAGVLF